MGTHASSELVSVVPFRFVSFEAKLPHTRSDRGYFRFVSFFSFVSFFWQ